MTKKIIISVLIFFDFLTYSNVNGQISPANNFIGVDVSTFPHNSAFNYDSCFALGAELGMKRVGMFQNWTSIETASNVFNLYLFDIANIYYPAYNMSVDLTITPIHTNNLEVPSDLTTTAFDSPVFIARFKTLLDSVKFHIPNVTLSSLVIGSEHDIYLGSNTTKWQQYTTFYNAVSAYAKTLWPGLKVATEITFTGITNQNTYVQTLNTNSDYIGVSYYPLNIDFTVKPVSVIPADFATLVGLYPAKPICFYQYGYPSGITCNSSELKQAQFIAQTFNSWDIYASNIKMIDFTWLHDLDTALVNYYGTYYGLTDPVFLEYLHTLGLRTWDGNGTAKLAFKELQCQAKQRGYNNLNIQCSSEVSEEHFNKNNIVTIFPNPVQNELNVSINMNLENAEIKIYNAVGQLVKEIKNCNKNLIRIETSSLSEGLYLIAIQNCSNQFIKNFLINK